MVIQSVLQFSVIHTSRESVQSVDHLTGGTLTHKLWFILARSSSSSTSGYVPTSICWRLWHGMIDWHVMVDRCRRMITWPVFFCVASQLKFSSPVQITLIQHLKFTCNSRGLQCCNLIQCCSICNGSDCPLQGALDSSGNAALWAKKVGGAGSCNFLMDTACRFLTVGAIINLARTDTEFYRFCYQSGWDW